jgi:hypothetical protein
MKTQRNNTRIGRNSDRITDNTVAFRRELERREAVSETISADYSLGMDKLAAFRRFQAIMDVVLATIIFTVIGIALAGFCF